MVRIIGAAEEFYRLRVIRLDDSGELDLEWRDDVLYRSPPATEVTEHEEWVLEAVTLDDAETVSRIGSYGDPEQAHQAREEWLEALQELTKSQFEERMRSSTEGA